MLKNRDRPENAKPLTIFSIPVKNNKKARKSIIDIEPTKGFINTMIDRIKIIIPIPI